MLFFSLLSIIFGAIALVGATFSFVPLVATMFSSFLFVCFSALTVAGIAFQYSSQRIKNSKNQKKLNKILKKIRTSNKEDLKDIKMSKSLIKLIKTNLSLCKTQGTSSFAQFCWLSDAPNERNVSIQNQIEQLRLLAQISNKTKDQKKYENKIVRKTLALSKSLEPQMPETRQRWAQTYIGYNNTQIVDHSTEIACMSESAKNSFEKYVKQASPKSKCGAAVVVKFDNKSNLRPIFARVPDSSLINGVKNIMLSDVAVYCSSLQEEEKNLLFPITIEKKVFKNTSTQKVGLKQTKMYSSMEMLARDLESIKE